MDYIILRCFIIEINKIRYFGIYRIKKLNEVVKQFFSVFHLPQTQNYIISQNTRDNNFSLLQNVRMIDNTFVFQTISIANIFCAPSYNLTTINYTLDRSLLYILFQLLFRSTIAFTYYKKSNYRILPNLLILLSFSPYIIICESL